MKFIKELNKELNKELKAQFNPDARKVLEIGITFLETKFKIGQCKI